MKVWYNKQSKHCWTLSSCLIIGSNSILIDFGFTLSLQSSSRSGNKPQSDPKESSKREKFRNEFFNYQINKWYVNVLNRLANWKKKLWFLKFVLSAYLFYIPKRILALCFSPEHFFLYCAFEWGHWQTYKAHGV